MNHPRMFGAGPLLAVAGAAIGVSPAMAQTGGGYELTWSTIDCGGSTGGSGGGAFNVAGTIGQPDAGSMSNGPFIVIGGFWSVTAPVPCYPNCDSSTVSPILNVLDFSCFLAKFGNGDPYANCDASTVPPILNVLDFSCFLTKFGAGCP